MAAITVPLPCSRRASRIIPTPGLPPGRLIFIACSRSARAGAIPPTPRPVSAATLVPPAPVTPVGLVAVPGNGQINLSWLASSGAGSYNLKRGTSSGGETTLVSTTGTAYTNTGLANGTTYYYAVSAVNAGGEGNNSREVSATPRDICHGVLDEPCRQRRSKLGRQRELDKHRGLSQCHRRRRQHDRQHRCGADQQRGSKHHPRLAEHRRRQRFIGLPGRAERRDLDVCQRHEQRRGTGSTFHQRGRHDCRADHHQQQPDRREQFHRAHAHAGGNDFWHQRRDLSSVPVL